MQTALIILQLIVGLGIYNVWLLRPHMQTAYRGRGAPNLKAEFIAYGLPVWFMYVAGAIKLAAATAILLGVWYTALLAPGALVLAVMMAGALAMHLKVRDSFTRLMPALLMLLMSMSILLLV